MFGPEFSFWAKNTTDRNSSIVQKFPCDVANDESEEFWTKLKVIKSSSKSKGPKNDTHKLANPSKAKKRRKD